MSSEDETKPKTMEDFFADFWSAQKGSGHETAWSFGDTERNGAKAKYFLLFTYDDERARAIHKCLGEAGLLCDETIGEIPEGTYYSTGASRES